MIASSKGNSANWEVAEKVARTTKMGGTKGQQLLPLLWREGERKMGDWVCDIFAEFCGWKILK